MPPQESPVLFVDDDVLLCRAIKRAVRRADISLHFCHTAARAVNLVRELNPGVILLDWVLPDRDGIALLKDFRDAHVTSPILMISGQTSLESKLKAFECGADDFVCKPFDTRELVARIKVHLKRSAEGLGVLHVGAITFDPWRQVAFVDDAPLDLSPSELSVLSYLVRHAEQVVPYSALVLATSKQEPEAASVKAVQVVTSRVRIKLGSASPQLQTIRGAGFCLHHDPPGE